MLNRLIGQGTAASLLKTGLTEVSERVRLIGGRVANAANGPAGGFAGALAEQQGAEAAAEPVDLEAEMVRLADEQLRFEASTRLLQKVYAQVRASVRER
jgi:hypothetical protein